MNTDLKLMGRALELARRGLYTCDPNPKVGCVLVREGRIIGEGWHQRAGQAHAEVNAIQNCGETTVGAAAYVTLEPCAHQGRTGPCAEALVEAGISEVFVAMEDPNPLIAGKGLARLAAAGVTVHTGLMEDTARALNAGFIKRMNEHLPWVRVKIAASLDGATALSNGNSKWITDEHARRDVHEWRARSSAIVTGAGTVTADNPRMTARLVSDAEVQQPLPVVLDSQFRSPLNAAIFARHALVFTRPGVQVSALDHIEFEQVRQMPDGGLDLSMVLHKLADREINEVLVEAGPTLSGAFVRQRLVDELLVYQAPLLMGNAARGMLDLGEIETMDDVLRLNLLDHCRIGECQRMIFRVRS